MGEQPSGFVQLVLESEAAIARIRELVVAGQGNTEEAGLLFEQIRVGVTPRLMGYIRRTGWLSPLLAEEALERMYERLFRDIWSLGFVSLELQFGAYLKAMPVRVLVSMRRQHVSEQGALPESLELPIVDDGLTLGEIIADRSKEGEHELIGLRELIQRLPDDERQVLLLRAGGIPNQEIARRRGLANATITRTYQRAIATLRRWLDNPEQAPPVQGEPLTAIFSSRMTRAAA